MKNSRAVIQSAIAGVLALGLTTLVQAADKAKSNTEKCYGVIKAGKNDCQTATNACSGNVKQDAQKDAWIYLPKGTCDKIVGASTKPKA